MSVSTASPIRSSGASEVQRADRILFVPEIGAFGGGERLYLALSRYLHQQGIPHQIVSYHQRINLQEYADWPLRLHQLTPPTSPTARAQALGDYLRRYAHENPGAPSPLLVGLQAAMHAATGGVLRPPAPYHLMVLDTPSLMTQSTKTDPVSRLRAGFSHWLTRKGLWDARSISMMTNVTADEIKTLYGIRPVVIRPGVALPDRIRMRAPDMRPLRLLSVCRLESSKRVDWILRAMAALEHGAPSSPLSRRVDWHLDIVGTGSQAEGLALLAAELGIAAQTTFHGAVSDARLAELYEAVHLSLMPAVQGYGLPALESLARRVPVVMHQESGVSEILGNTPWVEMIHGREEGQLKRGIAAMIERLLAGSLTESTLPPFPTETDWAREVCRHCGWEPAGT